MSKGSLVLERAAFEECQSLGKVKSSGKNKIGVDMDTRELLLLAVEALKDEGLNKRASARSCCKNYGRHFRHSS